VMARAKPLTITISRPATTGIKNSFLRCMQTSS
jgi:hypothetical protein